MALNSGYKLGPYEISAPLGAGGMGEVYKARDTRLDRSVAVNVLPDHIAHREDARARFERETRDLQAPFPRKLEPVTQRRGSALLSPPLSLTEASGSPGDASLERHRNIAGDVISSVNEVGRRHRCRSGGDA